MEQALEKAAAAQRTGTGAAGAGRKLRAMPSLYGRPAKRYADIAYSLLSSA